MELSIGHSIPCGVNLDLYCCSPSLLFEHINYCDAYYHTVKGIVPSAMQTERAIHREGKDGVHN